MTYLDTPVDATVSQWPSASVSYGDMCDFYNANYNSVETMKGDIESLNNTIAVLKRQNTYANNCITNAKVVIVEAFEGDEFDKDAFTAVAEALEIELTKEVNITAKAIFCGTVTVPLGFDVEEDLETYIEFEATASGRGKEDVEVDLWSEGDVEITVTN